MIFQYQSCNIQAYTREDVFTWYFSTGYLDSEAFQYLKRKSFYRKQIRGKSCGEADFDIESKRYRKTKGLNKQFDWHSFKILREYVNYRNSIWPIRTQLSVWGNRCKKSIYEPKLFYIFKKKKVGSLLPFTHPFISYRNQFAWYTVGTSVSPAAGITRATEKDVESAQVNKDPCQLSHLSPSSQHWEKPIRQKQYLSLLLHVREKKCQIRNLFSFMSNLY